MKWHILIFKRKFLKSSLSDVLLLPCRDEKLNMPTLLVMFALLFSLFIPPTVPKAKIRFIKKTKTFNPFPSLTVAAMEEIGTAYRISAYGKRAVLKNKSCTPRGGGGEPRSDGWSRVDGLPYLVVIRK